MVVAIVVGVSKYQDQEMENLPGAQADALFFAQSLRTWGVEEKNIHLFLDEDATKESVTSCLAKLAEITEPFKLVFYYCGHGGRSPNPDPRSYLLLAESQVSLDDLLRLICRANAKETYLFLDACHLRINSLINPELEREMQGKENSRKALFCLLSSGVDESYEDVEGEYGYFTNALIRGLAEIRQGENTPTLLLEKIGSELEQKGLPLPEMYNVGTHRIHFFSDVSSENRVSIFDFSVQIFKNIEQQQIKKVIGAITACGMYFSKQLLCSIFGLKAEALNLVEEIGLVFQSRTGWVPHELLFTVAESERVFVDSAKAISYWCHEIEEASNKVQAAKSLILTVKCFGYQQEVDNHLIKAFNILKPYPSEHDFLSKEATEIFISHGAVSKAGLFLASFFDDLGELERKESLRSLPLVDNKKQFWGKVIAATATCCLGINFYFMLTVGQQTEKFVSLPSKYENFVGREEILQTLKQKLIKSPGNKLPVVALFGEGGIGKSETAIAFANDHISDFSLIFWINAGSEAIFQQSYLRLAQRLNIPTGPHIPFEKVKEKIIFTLENKKFRKPWLLIYDNADKAIDVPNRGDGRILITTRIKENWRSAKIIQIPLFSETASNELFHKVLQEAESIVEWHKLAKNLNHIPLALDQALHYVKESTTFNLASYNALLEEKTSDILKCTIPNARYSYNLLSIWHANAADLQLNQPKAYQWLQLCSFLHPDKIPIDWLTRWLQNEGVSEHLAKLETNEILRTLMNRGYITLNKNTQSFSIHRLKQKLVEQSEDTSTASLEKTLAFLASMVKGYENHVCIAIAPSIWDQLSDWEASAIWLLDENGERLVESENKALILSVLGNINVRIKSKFKQGIEQYVQAQAIINKVYGPEHLKVIYNLDNQGFALLRLGFYEQARVLYLQALQMSKNLFSDEPNRITARCLGAIAMLLCWTNDEEEALDYCKKALAMQRLIDGSKPIYETCELVKWLGRIWASLGDSEKSIAYTLEAQEMNRVLSNGKPTIQTCYILNNLGTEYRRIGNIDQALKCHLEVYKIYETLLKNECAVSLITLKDIATEYRLKKDCKKALIYLKKGAKFIEEAHSNHLDISCLLLLSCFGDVYFDLKDYKKAAFYYNDVVKNADTILNGSNVVYSNAYQGLGKIELYLGNFEKGTRLLEDALNVLLSHYSEKNRLLLPILNDLGQAYKKQNPAKSEEYFSWAEKIKQAQSLSVQEHQAGKQSI